MQTKRFFEKSGITADDLMYVFRNGRKTCFHADSGDDYESYIALHEICESLPERDFLRINKSVILSKRHIASIENGVYTMTDGRQFRGRVRTPGQHTENQKALFAMRNHQTSASGSVNLLSTFTSLEILDRLPLPSCILELVFDHNGSGMDFVFRYCNPSMCSFENKHPEQLIGHSFFELFQEGHQTWIVAYADVALNGGSRVLEEYNSNLDKKITLHCFQIRERFCGCVLVAQ